MGKAGEIAKVTCSCISDSNPRDWVSEGGGIAKAIYSCR